MKPTPIRGYSVLNQPVDVMIAAKTLKRLSNLRGIPQCAISRPVIEMLTGEKSWDEMRKQISQLAASKTRKTTSTSPDLALIVPDLDKPTRAIAVKHPLVGEVVPAVVLGVDVTPAGFSGKNIVRWNAEAVAIRTNGLAEAVALTFNSASVSALLLQAGESFRKVFSPINHSAANLDYLIRTGNNLLPDQPDKQKWIIASTWPDWQWRRLPFPARAHDLSLLENTLELGSDNLRQKCWRMGLVRGDKTDA